MLPPSTQAGKAATLTPLEHMHIGQSDMQCKGWLCPAHLMWNGIQPGLKLPTFSCDNSQRGWWRRKYQQRWLSVSWEVLLHLAAAGSWVGSAGVELHGADVGLCVLFLSISSLPCMCSMHSSAGRALAWLFLLLDLV